MFRPLLMCLLFALSLALLPGCQESSTETARDVAGARRDAAEAEEKLLDRVAPEPAALDDHEAERAAMVGAWWRPRSFLARVYSSKASIKMGKILRNTPGSTWETVHAPIGEPINPAPAAGSKERQGMTTLRLYCTVAKAVPQIEALLLVPNKVAGAA